MHILIAAHDGAEKIARALQAAGHHTTVSNDAEEAADFARMSDVFNFVVVDREFDQNRGLNVLRSARTINRKGAHLPVLVLSNDDRVQEKVRVLGMGADDYMNKPVNIRELVARFHAVARRSENRANDVLEFDDLIIDLAAKTAFIGSQKVKVTDKEYKYLSTIAKNNESVTSVEKIMAEVYGDDDGPDAGIIGAYICKLRKKLATASATSDVPEGFNYIDTVWGRGFCMRQTKQPTTELQAKHGKVANEPLHGHSGKRLRL